MRHEVTVNGRSELLSAREYALLGYLIRHSGQVVTRQQILDSVWGAEPDVYSNVVDLYVHYLRRKLDSLGQRRRRADSSRRRLCASANRSEYGPRPCHGSPDLAGRRAASRC